ncbi:MAG: hypothetical protein ACO1OC_09670 [Tuberibacillus sp.]
MGDRKNGTMILFKNAHNQNGFILPAAMIMVLFFTFYVMYAIDRLTDERDFLQKRQIAVQLDLQKKMSVKDLLTLLDHDATYNTSGEILFPDYKLKYSISAQDLPTINVMGTILYKNNQDSFSFIYNVDTKQIIKWVD